MTLHGRNLKTERVQSAPAHFDDVDSSVVTVLDFSFSVDFGSVLEEKPPFRFQFSSPCALVSQCGTKCAAAAAICCALD